MSKVVWIVCSTFFPDVGQVCLLNKEVYATQAVCEANGLNTVKGYFSMPMWKNTTIITSCVSIPVLTH